MIVLIILISSIGITVAILYLLSFIHDKYIYHLNKKKLPISILKKIRNNYEYKFKNNFIYVKEKSTGFVYSYKTIRKFIYCLNDESDFITFMHWLHKKRMLEFKKDSKIEWDNLNN